MVAVTVTATSPEIGVIYAKSMSLKDWEDVRKVQHKLVDVLNGFADLYRQHKSKGVKVSALPSVPIVIRLSTPSPVIYNEAGFTIPVDPKFGGDKVVSDALTRHLRGF